MGLMKKLRAAFGKRKKEAKIIVVGLDNSGKTTLINHLKPKKAATFDIVPTVGYSVERFQKDKLAFEVFDMSGQGRYRNMWEKFYADVNAIIFVIDSTDKLRMAMAKDELEQMLTHSDVKGTEVPILFYANKMDVKGAMEASDVMAVMAISTITDHPWHIQPSNALTGAGVGSGVTWLAEALEKKGSSRRK